MQIRAFGGVTRTIGMRRAVCMQAEHARSSTQFAYQGHTSATGSAAASALLGEIYQAMGNHGAALSAFTTAMTVLTQHGLRTQQGGAVMRHIGRCLLQQGEYRKARSHLSEVRKLRHAVDHAVAMLSPPAAPARSHSAWMASGLPTHGSAAAP